MRLLAPAKINLHLRVGSRQEDGFHPLLSWMTTVGLFDTLDLDPHDRATASPDDGGAAAIELQCDLPGLPCDERNLIVRIALAWRGAVRGEWAGGPKHGCPSVAQYSSSATAGAGRKHVGGLRVMLQKRIPVGGGLGGGSSDGARTLMGLNRLWRMGRAADDLSAFAARFGSDLPFFFHGPSSVCRGRGEVVTPVPAPTPMWAVLVLPEISMPTSEVYRRFDDMGLGREQDIEHVPDWQVWAKLASEELLARLVNDLEPPAFSLAPDLSALRARIEKTLGRIVRMSGSGSSLFTLFDQEPQAREAAEHIENELRQRAPVVKVCPGFRDDLNDDIR